MMGQKKKEKIHAIIFPRNKFRKSETYKWFRENKDIIDLKKTISDIKKLLKRIDGDYILYLRPKYKFKNTKSKLTNRVKIISGKLK